MAGKSVSQMDPNFNVLETLFEQHFPRKSKSEIFDEWEMMIQPDEPQITLKQFQNWTRKAGQKKTQELRRIERETTEQAIAISERHRAVTISQLEKRVRQGQSLLIDDAIEIASSAKDQPLKERYYANNVLSTAQKGIQKEKDLAIKAQKEKRETVGMFAKLAGSAMSGEILAGDLDILEEQEHGTDEPTKELAEQAAA